MKRATTPYLLLWFCLFPLLAAEAQIREESISGRSYRAIQAAVPELERNKLNVADYRITVYEDDLLLIVLFRNPNAPQELGHGRIPGRKTTFSVKLGKDDFQVISASFERH